MSLQRHNQFPRHRGRGRGGGRGGFHVPSIYRSGKSDLSPSIVIQDSRLAQSSTLLESLPDPNTSISNNQNNSVSELDPFQASLNDFIKHQELHRNQTTDVLANLDFSKRQLKPDLFPQDKNFFCDKCYRGYNTKHMFDQHVASHVKCTHEGCNFAANAWFLAKHIMNVHNLGVGSGSSNQSGSNRWVEERKRKFPSQAIQDEKLEMAQQKLKRGEVIEPTKFGKFRSNLVTPKNCAVESKEKHDVQDSQKPKPETSEQIVEVSEEKGIEENSSKIDTDQEAGPSDFKRYNKIQWDESEKVEHDKIPEDLKKILDEAEQQSSCQSGQRPKRQRNSANHHNRPSLLEMLLKDDIVHERNILLQCVKHVVRENFFIGSS